MNDRNVSFEEAMERLESNVKALESGELSLDEVLQKFEEGVSLIKTCYQKLNDAEQKIEILIGSLEEAPKDEGR
ncbi:MAG: exodeoxyribonuclease VII small subunit [Bacillota bacterium]|jgi:exodeoxyribonuclease VII small subunit